MRYCRYKNILCEFATEYGYCQVTACIKRLPSVQPEPCDDPRADIYYLAEKIGIHRLYALVVELRGEPELCEDAVSRQGAIDALLGITAMQNTIPLDSAIFNIKKLPSAQPERKKGEWALQSDDYHEYYECDQCGIAVGLDDVRNFCPNCGADMRGEQDGGHDQQTGGVGCA